MIVAAVFAVALIQAGPVPALPATAAEARAWPLIAEDGVFQRRRGPVTLGAGETISVWTAALPQERHAATLGAVFRRFEFDCPASRLRRGEALALQPGETIAAPIDAGDEDFVYPGSQPAWVGALFSEVCSPGG